MAPIFWTLWTLGPLSPKPVMNTAMVYICRVARVLWVYNNSRWRLMNVLRGVSLTTTDRLTGRWTILLYGQIAWADGPLPGRTVLRWWWNPPRSQCKISSRMEHFRYHLSPSTHQRLSSPKSVSVSQIPSQCSPMAWENANVMEIRLAGHP